MFVSNNLMMIGAIRLLDEIRNERDISVGIVGFDLDEVPLLAAKHIASVHQDPHEMGRIAGGRILLRQKNFTTTRRLIELTPTFGPVRWD